MNRGGKGQYSRGGYNNRYSSRGRGRGGGSRGTSRSTEFKGVFADGIWHCNCTPRLPAEHFKVKKESKNQGRWFYTCQNQEPKRCDFFLWDEDAKLREEGAVLNNSKSEPKSRQVPTAQEGWDAGRSRGGMFAGIDPISMEGASTRQREDEESTEEGSPPPAYSSQQQGKGASKRKANAVMLDDDQDDDLLRWPLTGQEEEELVNAADSIMPPPETPRKVAKTGIYATPVTTVEKKRTLPWQQVSAVNATTPTTPSLVGRQQTDYLDTPSTSPTKAPSAIPDVAYGPTPTLQASIGTPQVKSPPPPSRHRDALSNPADSSSALTNEALAALAGTSIPPSVLSNLRGILSKHDLKSQGVVKGRDISRLGLKAKEAKIVELQARIASLEAEKEVDRGVIRALRWEGENGARGVVDED